MNRPRDCWGANKNVVSRQYQKVNRTYSVVQCGSVMSTYPNCVSRFCLTPAAMFLLSVLPALPAPPTEKGWAERRNAGVQAFRQGTYADSEKILTDCLADAEKSGQDAAIAAALSDLAMTYRA